MSIADQLEAELIEISARSLRKALRRNHCAELRQKGSHLQIRCGACQSTIPMHGGDINTGTMKGIERSLGACLGPNWTEIDARMALDVLDQITEQHLFEDERQWRKWMLAAQRRKDQSAADFWAQKLKKSHGTGHGTGHGSKIKTVAHAIGHALVEPFHKAYKLATSKEERQQTMAFLKGAVEKETKETKHLFGVLRDAIKGRSVSKADRTAAMHQVADMVKVALTATLIGHLAAGGVGHLLATLASPADELIGMALDKPLQKITSMVFGKAHGLLPSAFYESVGNEKDLLEKIFNAILDEMSKEDIDLSSLKAA